MVASLRPRLPFTAPASFLVHNNQIHGSRAKVTRFQTAKLWLLDKSAQVRTGSKQESGDSV